MGERLGIASLVGFGVGVVLAIATAVFWRLHCYCDTDPSWYDSYAWACILTCPLSFGAGQVGTIAIFAMKELAEYVMNHVYSRR